MKRKYSFTNLYFISVLQDVGITFCFRLQQKKGLAAMLINEGHEFYFMNTAHNLVIQFGHTNAGKEITGYFTPATATIVDFS